MAGIVYIGDLDPAHGVGFGILNGFVVFHIIGGLGLQGRKIVRSQAFSIVCQGLACTN
jgi:hypothetical protein